MNSNDKPAAVRPSEILLGADYERERPAIRAAMLKVKSRRRVHLGESLTFLFENSDTVRYQVQEMMRVEKRSSPEDLAHELATYNELLGGPGALGCTLLIEIEDASQRDKLLRDWLALPSELYLELEDGSRVPAQYDARQVGEDRLSSVQYLIFDCAGKAPIAVGCELAAYKHRAELTPVQRKALAEDLRASA